MVVAWFWFIRHIFLWTVLRNRDAMTGLAPKLTTLKECATGVILKLFFSKTLNFCQFLANCVENGDVWNALIKFYDQK